jgi:hypothetical protein
MELYWLEMEFLELKVDLIIKNGTSLVKNDNFSTKTELHGLIMGFC